MFYEEHEKVIQETLKYIEQHLTENLEASLEFLGGDLMQKLADADVEELDIQALEEMNLSIHRR